MVDPILRGCGCSVDDAVEVVRGAVAEHWDSPNQRQRLLKVLDRFSAFARAGFEVVACGDVSPVIVSEFVHAVTVDGVRPSIPLMHFRRSALRVMFRSLRQSGYDVGDPTLDLVLPPRSQLRTRALVDDEVLLCRGHSRWAVGDLRRAAAWALAEATCRSVEIAQIRIGDVDVPGERVWIHGGRTTVPRWGRLTPWGLGQLERRISTLADAAETRVVYGGNGDRATGQVSACVAIVDVLTRAGLAGEPDVRPSSIAAWAGRRILDETGRVDEVARRLGLTSLDRAARFISFDWETERE